ncbi:proline-rich protein HaeIII subfamily 1-like [Gambusia affinis]|uniref:proline-rich protein HaeIII subfamily 1-like n=1 Tax=Gambusia affinis TaxID=33528 RepID=UPI001CDB6C49|nr:proline-rich protein HaeIII subfamily 1-like [Gambusia affinis]
MPTQRHYPNYCHSLLMARHTTSRPPTRTRWPPWPKSHPKIRTTLGEMERKSLPQLPPKAQNPSTAQTYQMAQSSSQPPSPKWQTETRGVLPPSGGRRPEPPVDPAPGRFPKSARKKRREPPVDPAPRRLPGTPPPLSARRLEPRWTRPLVASPLLPSPQRPRGGSPPFPPGGSPAHFQPARAASPLPRSGPAASPPHRPARGGCRRTRSGRPGGPPPSPQPAARAARRTSPAAGPAPPPFTRSRPRRPRTSSAAARRNGLPPQRRRPSGLPPQRPSGPTDFLRSRPRAGPEAAQRTSSAAAASGPDFLRSRPEAAQRTSSGPAAQRTSSAAGPEAAQRTSSAAGPQ